MVHESDRHPKTLKKGFWGRFMAPGRLSEGCAWGCHRGQIGVLEVKNRLFQNRSESGLGWSTSPVDAQKPPKKAPGVGPWPQDVFSVMHGVPYLSDRGPSVREVIGLT